MSYRRKLFPVLCFIISSSLLLAACSSSVSRSLSKKPAFGGTVVDGLSSDATSVMPWQVGGNPDNVLVDAAIWAPLFYGNDSYDIEPGITSDVPSVENDGISPDFKTFTIHLRPDIRWSDGTPETSEDVAFSFRLFSNPAYPTGFPSSEIVRISTPDPTTIIIALNTVDVTFLYDLVDPAAAPLPRHIFGSMSPDTILESTQAHQPPVVSGPFMIKERVTGDHITMAKNPHYYQAPKPYLDSITFKVLPDKNSRLTALQSGSIDTAWNLDVDELRSFQAIPGYRMVVDKTIAQQEMLFFNLTNHWLADITVRRAITMAIDVRPIMSSIWHSLATLSCDDNTGSWAHEASLIPCYKYDPVAAMNLLESDGFVMGSDGYFTKGGEELDLRWSATADQGFRIRSETIEQDQLKKIGIKVEIVNYPPSTLYGDVVNSGNFDVIEDYYGTPYNPDDHILWDCNQTPNKGGYNLTRWCDPKVDQADAQQLRTLDQSQRMTAFRVIHSELLSQVPVMFLYGFPNIACARTVIQNYSPMEAGPSETWNVWDWWRTDA
jgi:peptide/nickel transport system substrate-binding protein